jgi:oxygen-independent coproporphyrinogen III oxidase
MKSLYIHVPFCIRKCDYCDFVSFPGMDKSTIDRYVDAVCEECRAKEEFLSEGISTLYFGGGTPSLLSPAQVERIFSAISHVSYYFPDGQEITIEANPDTVDVDKLAGYRISGINRISLGAQSFDDRLLKILGRIHTVKDTVNAYNCAREAGFDNLNLDLMFALPNQSLSDWEETLKISISLKPEHLSVYNLQVEESTPMWKKRYSPNAADEKLVFPDEDEDAEMYLFALRYLQQNGFNRYEISNFALDGKECRHNIAYWENRDYLGIGVAAHSCINGKRWANTTSLKRYLTSPESAVEEITPATDLSRRQETLFLGLRLSKGVETKHFEGFEKDVDELLREELIEEKDGRYRLTEQGVLLGNQVFAHFV